MKNLIYLAIIIITLQCISSCTQSEEPKEETPVDPFTISRVEQLPKENMAAKVLGDTITIGDVDREAEIMLRKYSGNVTQEQLQELIPKLWNQAMENLVNKKVLLHEADIHNLEPDQNSVLRKYDELLSAYPNPDKFSAHLLQAGITETQFKQQIVQDLKIETLLDEQIADIPEPTEEEVETYFKENQGQFITPHRVRASHILKKISEEDDQTVKRQRMQELMAIREEIIKGADFAQQAALHSECPSKEKGGDLGFFERGKMVEPFENAAFKLQIGEISDVIETEFGFHIIKVTDIEEERPLRLDEVKDRIFDYLKTQRSQRAIKDYINALRQQVDVEYAPEFG